MSELSGFDCFLSYASEDRAVAEAIYERLEGAGFRVWFDKARLSAGFRWHEEIEQACESSRVILPILSPSWKLSQWTRYETYGAENIIPLLVRGAWDEVLTPPLARLQGIELRLGAAGDEWDHLFDVIRQLADAAPMRRHERLHNLRYQTKNKCFGREKDLAELQEKLFNQPTADLSRCNAQAISALGGVGKTTLARHYAEKYWRCYRQVFWADCRIGLELEFAAICSLIRPSPEFETLSAQERAIWVKRELNQSADRPQRLLIIDNAENEEVIRDWIPTTGTCHVIITSRFRGWSPAIGVHTLAPLEPAPARNMLVCRSGRHGQDEEKAAAALAERLGFLPLALEQAAAYVAQQPSGWGFEEYLRLYEENELKFLRRTVAGLTEYDDSVYMTWRTTVERLPNDALAVLHLHSFLAPTPIRVDIFVRGASLVSDIARSLPHRAGGENTDSDWSIGEYEIRQSISALADYSMARLEAPDSFSVHDLVHLVTWYEMAESRFEKLTAMTRIFLASLSIPSWESQNRQLWSELLPHADRLNESARKLKAIPNPELLWLSCQARIYQGDHRGAIPLLAELSNLAESGLVGDFSFAASVQHNLAFCLLQAGEHKQAEALLRPIVERSLATLGLQHPDTLTSMNTLGEVLRAKGSFAEGETLCLKVLQIRELTLGPEHPSTLTSVSNLASFKLTLGDYEAAEALYTRVLDVYEREQPEHPDTLKVRNNVAEMRRAQGKLEPAEDLFRQVVDARRRVLGSGHPDTLASFVGLAGTLEDRGRYPEANQILTKTLAERERLLGPAHPDTVTTKAQLAILRYAMGKYEDADLLLREAMENAKATLGSSHPTTVTMTNSLGLFWQRRGDYQQAELLFRTALDQNERTFGKENFNTFANINNLASVLWSKGSLEDAEDLYRKLLALYAGSFGREHFQIPIVKVSLGAIVCQRGNFTEGLALCADALESAEKILGPDHPRTLVVVNNFGKMLESSGDLERAEGMYRRAAETSNRVLGSGHPDAVTFSNNLGWLLYTKGDHDSAVPLLRNALSARELVLSATHPETLKSLLQLAEVLESQHIYSDEAKDLRLEHARRSKRE